MTDGSFASERLSASSLEPPRAAVAKPADAVRTFEEYVAARGDWLHRTCFLLTSDSHLAEDLSQTVLVQIYRRWDRVTAAASPDAYVRTVALNEYRNMWRRRSFHERPESELGDSDAFDPQDLAAAVVGRDALLWQLRQLSPRERAVLVLRYVEDIEDRKIADLLGVREATVRSIARRALRRMHEQISDYESAQQGAEESP